MAVRLEILRQLGGSKEVFVTTSWTLVLQAAQENSPAGQDALAELCRQYWYPLYAFARRQGQSPEDAQDAAQELFSRLLQGRWLATVTPERGKFRSWLLACLKNLLANEHKREHTAKRGGDTVKISLDAASGEERYALEPSTTITPERLFERRWALTLLERALARLRAECEADGKGELFADLQDSLLGESQTATLAEIAKRRGMSEGAVKTAAYRLRNRHRELLREEIGRTVESPSQVDEEIRELLAVLTNP